MDSLNTINAVPNVHLVESTSRVDGDWGFDLGVENVDDIVTAARIHDDLIDCAR